MITFFAHWVHNLDPFAIRFPKYFFIEGIRWYGVAYVVGFIIAAFLLNLYYKHGKSPLNSDKQTSLLINLILGILIGGRLGYLLFYDLNRFLEDPFIFFEFEDGGIRGMSSHGGFVGVLLATLWFAKRKKVDAWALCDIVATLPPAGIFLGRIANFINGELWGRVSDVPWAVIFPQSVPWLPVTLLPARHPSQLYAALLEGLVLLVYTQWRFWKKPVRFPGQLLGEFFILYALMRIIGECFREPDAELILGISRGQFYSIFLLLGGLFVVWLARRQIK